jgi:hypothetical protein
LKDRNVVSSWWGMENGTVSFGSGEGKVGRRDFARRPAMKGELGGGGMSAVMRMDVRFWSSKSSTREVPEDELAIFSDTDEPHRSFLRSFGIESDSGHPARVSRAVSYDVLLVRCVHR